MGFLDINSDYKEKYGFSYKENAIRSTGKGLSEAVVREISEIKGEPKWMLDLRLKAYKIYLSKPMPTWGAPISDIDFDNITYYIKPSERNETSWEDVPTDIKETFDRLGIPEAEKRFLGGVGAQYESETVYHSIREDLKKQGVIFTDTDSALKEHEEIVKKYFGTVVPAGDNKFAALNTAVWSGGSFVFIPAGVKVTIPLQAYFRINAKNMGQFERTLIIADKGAEVTYIEGCTAPVYSTDSLHSAVVELIALEGSKIRYTTIQNWSSNVYNLVTKRAFAYKDATVEWVDGNIGSKRTMKYPSVYLKEPGAKADILSVAFAGEGQYQDTGGKVIHMAPNTSSKIVAKSIANHGGTANYRGLIKVYKKAIGSAAHMRCDSLLLDEKSHSDAYPVLNVDENDVSIAHEATVGKIGDDQLFYLMSRGLSKSDAMSMIILGFINEFTKQLPMEYAVELNKLIQIELEGHSANTVKEKA